KWSLLHPKNKIRVHILVERYAERFGVRVYRFSNVGNHIHLLVKAPTREAFRSFLRALAGGIAFAVTGAKKRNPVGRFWSSLAYTRVLRWGQEFKRVQLYLVKNLLESLGVFEGCEQKSGLRLSSVTGAPRPIRP
ncbi:MAG: transposase, partial [Bdellovibrionota bacterium]